MFVYRCVKLVTTCDRRTAIESRECVTIKCLQSITSYDILLHQGDYKMLQVFIDPVFTFALGVLYTAGVITWLRHVPADKPGVKRVTECVRD